MARAKQYSAEVRERAVRLVGEHAHEYESEWAAIQSVAQKIGCSGGRDGERVRWESRELYARPMMSVDVAVDGRSGEALDAAVREIVRATPSDAVLRVRVTGTLREEHLRVLRAAHVRTYVPATMNVEVRAGDGSVFGRRSMRGRSKAFRRQEEAGSGAVSGPQLELL